MAYTANDYQKLVKDYVESPAGRKFLMSKQVQTKSYWYTQAEEIAKNLKKDLIEGFLSIVNEPGATFDEEAVSIIPIAVPGKYGKGDFGFRILFTNKALERPRLVGERGSLYAAEQMGVYDIFGLFTQGYQASAYAYGHWDGIDAGGLYEKTDIIRSRRARMGNDFINHIIHAYQILYPDVIFDWPKEWGGNS